MNYASNGARELSGEKAWIDRINATTLTSCAWEFEVAGPPDVIFVRASLPLPSSDLQRPALLQTSSMKHTFIIEAPAPGKAEVRLVLRRPWEKDVPPVRVISVRLTVISVH